MRCATESRKLVKDATAGAGNVSEMNVDLEKIDGCSEVTLGLLATFITTILIVVVFLPFFNVAGISWVKSWDTDSHVITMPEWKAALRNSYHDVGQTVFNAMDKDADGIVHFPEFRQVGLMLTPRINASDIEYAYKGTDENQDGVLDLDEYMDAMAYDHFFAPPVQKTTTTPMPSVPLPQAQMTFPEMLAHMEGEAHVSPTDAFDELDIGGGGTVSPDEFSKASKMFPRPLSDGEAAFCFGQLDRNGNNKVEAVEFFQAYEKDEFLPPGPTTELITLEDYKSRLAKASLVIAIMVKTPGVGLDKLDKAMADNALEDIVEPLAAACGLDSKFVQNLQWQENAISFVDGETAEGRIVFPPGTSMAAKLQAVETKAVTTIAKNLVEDNIPGIDPTKVMLFARTAGVFGSIDHDKGTLEFNEFRAAIAQFQPPLSLSESRYCFEGLDQDMDRRLDPKEFRGNDLNMFLQKLMARPEAKPVPEVPAPAAGDAITLPDFVKRMGGLAPDIAFEALDEDAKGTLTQQEMIQDTTEFFPELTKGQAIYAFNGLDANGDKTVSKQEFLEVLHSGHFYKRALRGSERV